MRESKFRAWDTTRNIMVYSGDEWLPPSYKNSYEHSYPVTVTNCGIYYTKKLNKEQENDYYIDVHQGAKFVGSFYRDWEAPALYQYKDGEIIPLEFTGLKDKNGREIYEGDIMLLPDIYKDVILDDGSGPEEPFNHLSPVVYNFGTFGLEIQHSGEIFIHGFWSFEHILSEDGVLPKNLEVIGNIYENPELLK